MGQGLSALPQVLLPLGDSICVACESGRVCDLDLMGKGSDTRSEDPVHASRCSASSVQAGLMHCSMLGPGKCPTNIGHSINWHLDGSRDSSVVESISEFAAGV